MLDGLGNAAGYSAVLLLVAFVRELLGAGSLFGINVLPLLSEGGWYQPMRLMLLAPSAFIILGLLIWLARSLRPQQSEVREFPLLGAQEARRP
jgi:Na+-transporting NADH:ubiquinone oxidoreductase subunit D